MKKIESITIKYTSDHDFSVIAVATEKNMNQRIMKNIAIALINNDHTLLEKISALIVQESPNQYPQIINKPLI